MGLGRTYNFNFHKFIFKTDLSYYPAHTIEYLHGHSAEVTISYSFSQIKSSECHSEYLFSRSMFSEKELFAEDDHQGKDDSESDNRDMMI